jgi:hypothetical protein
VNNINEIGINNGMNQLQVLSNKLSSVTPGLSPNTKPPGTGMFVQKLEGTPNF